MGPGLTYASLAGQAALAYGPFSSGLPPGGSHGFTAAHLSDPVFALHLRRAWHAGMNGCFPCNGWLPAWPWGVVFDQPKSNGLGRPKWRRRAHEAIARALVGSTAVGLGSGKGTVVRMTLAGYGRPADRTGPPAHVLACRGFQVAASCEAATSWSQRGLDQPSLATPADAGGRSNCRPAGACLAASGKRR